MTDRPTDPLLETCARELHQPIDVCWTAARVLQVAAARGTVDFADLGIFHQRFGQPPGPSGIVPWPA